MALYVQQSRSSVWDTVLQQTKLSQRKSTDPLIWAVQLSSTLTSAGITFPSVELAHVLVSHICWGNHVPITWKFLEKALSMKLVPALLVLALLSSRVIPNRQIHPAAYRLYMELLRRNAFFLESHIRDPNIYTIMKSVDNVLQLSKIYETDVFEPGIFLVELVFSTVRHLLEASLDDEGFLGRPLVQRSRWLTRPEGMDIDGHNEGLIKANTAMAIEIIGDFLQNRQTSRILHLARKNMPSHWGPFIEQVRLLTEKSSAVRNLKQLNSETLLHIISNDRVLSQSKSIWKLDFYSTIASGSQLSCIAGACDPSQSAIWLPIDIFLEDCVDGSQVSASSPVEILTGLVKGLQAVNGTTWHGTFLGLWAAALRVVQRGREPAAAHVETCMCMLLCTTTLAIANIIEEKEGQLIEEAEHGSLTVVKKEKETSGRFPKELIMSLQLLGDIEALLTPPQSVCSLANQAASKAVMFISGLKDSNGNHDFMSANDLPLSCPGDLRHLIVEACIARNLLDTSAYFWPGYVNARRNEVSCTLTCELPGWSSLMKGSPLTSPLAAALVSTPATRLAEVEKIYEIAVNGSDEEKISAATILCGASLVRGWNVQEHVAVFIIKLLSCPVTQNYSGTDSQLVNYAPSLNALLIGISSGVQIFSLHGLVPLLAAAVMPICEVFGSCVPSTLWTHMSCHAVFSNALTLVFQLSRSQSLPHHEHVMNNAWPVGTKLSLDYLLLVRNTLLNSSGKSSGDRVKSRRLSNVIASSSEPVFMGFFPKLESWSRQLECIASTPGLVHGAAIHQIVDALLGVMFRHINKGNQPLSPTSGSSSSSTSSTKDASLRLKVPAWDILEAIPLVLDAALTACAHGRLSPRDLTTGLKCLADFLPASLATIVSYFSAEVLRGVWPPASMNGIDWPSPGATLSSVEHQIKKILASTGVDVPSLAVGGNSLATVPLPLASLVSFAIACKLDKASERFLVLVGPALASSASSWPWPCMPIIASLWIQEVKCWSDFILSSASNTVFQYNKNCLIKLIRSCFTSTLGITSDVYCNGGVGALLGHGFGSHFSDGFPPVTPGILYLKLYRSIGDVLFFKEEIVSLLMLFVQEIGSARLPKEQAHKLKNSKSGMRYGQVSLSASMRHLKVVASLGASMLWFTGGSNLVQSLIKETIPSRFLSVHKFGKEGVESGDVVAKLRGYALAYLTIFCVIFAWGIDTSSPHSKWRGKVLSSHLEFLANVLNGKILLSCDRATWWAYVTGFVSQMVHCTPLWVLEVDVNVLKRLSEGLRQWDEEELAIALLGLGGKAAMSAAAEMIVGIGC